MVLFTYIPLFPQRLSVVFTAASKTYSLSTELSSLQSQDYDLAHDLKGLVKEYYRTVYLPITSQPKLLLLRLSFFHPLFPLIFFSFSCFPDHY